MEAQEPNPKMETISVQSTAKLGPRRSIIGQSRDHRIVMDVSKVRGGDDSGPSPPECLALSLAGCVLNLIRVLGEERGLACPGLEVGVKGMINPARAFGLESEFRAGFLDFQVTVKGGDGWPREEKLFLLDALQNRCPICDNLANPTDVRFEIGLD